MLGPHHIPALLMHSDRLEFFTQAPYTGIAAPSTATLFYIVQTPRGTTTVYHIIHATNGSMSHLLPGLRDKVIPLRGVMTVQRLGNGLQTATAGRAVVWWGGSAMWASGAVRGRSRRRQCALYGHCVTCSGALPEYFGPGNWGVENLNVSREVGEDGAWDQGRIKALWTGILGISADLRLWVGRVPSLFSHRAVPPPIHTRVLDDADG
ncbi:hypothetical protein F5148DRAFT_548384 [Russula earlei]|uniref:Uncharacterized protein n=1 Tax=Russula earlei TaxID=71964 RepID=A0ACC0UHT7_9AGAM|nr:hypothetical protein F5148DRAFT_548384 [Russula earlei]